MGPNGERHVFHVEFGHFYNLKHFELFEKYAVSNADSLGVNEVEIKRILQEWVRKVENIELSDKPATSIDEVLEDTKHLFSLAARQNLPLTRVHAHPYGSFLMCYHTDRWESAAEAIIKSSIVLPMYCQRNEDGSVPENWLEMSDIYEIPPRPKHIVLPNKTVLDID